MQRFYCAINRLEHVPEGHENGEGMNEVKQKLSLLCYGKASQRFYITNHKLFRKGNWKAARLLCMAGVLLCACLSLISLLENVLYENMLMMEVTFFYAGGAALSATLYLLCRFRIPKDSWAVPVCFWTEYMMLYLLCVGLELVCCLESPALLVFFVTLLATVIYMEMPIRMILTAFVSDMAVCVITSVRLEQEPVVVGLVWRIGVIALGITVILIHYVRNLQMNRLQDELRYQSQINVDHLTGLLSKDYTATICRMYLSEKPPEELCVIMVIDLDDFEEIKEVYGQQMGDDALSTMGQILKGVFRERDIIGRVGTDRFLVCMKGVRDERIISKRANEISVRFRQKVHEIGVDSGSCSIGVRSMRQEHLSYEKLYAEAEKVLWQAREEAKKTEQEG